MSDACEYILRKAKTPCGAKVRFRAHRNGERMSVCGKHANSLALVLPKWIIFAVDTSKP